VAVRRARDLWRRCGACAVVAVLGVAGCGGHPDAPKLPPGVGYHPTAPVLPTGVAAGTPLVVDLNDTAAVRPAGMRVASDGTLTGMHWSSWGQQTARAQGSAMINLCSPDCGSGPIRKYPATVTLTGLKRCGSHDFYARATVTLATVAGARSFGAFIHAPCVPEP